MPLAVGDLANHVESVELQPLCEITSLGVVDINVLCLFQEELRCIIDEGLILDQGRHGKSRVYTSAKCRVEIVVRGAKQGLQTMTLGDGLLYDVEVRLTRLSESPPYSFGNTTT